MGMIDVLANVGVEELEMELKKERTDEERSLMNRTDSAGEVSDSSADQDGSTTTGRFTEQEQKILVGVIMEDPQLYRSFVHVIRSRSYNKKSWMSEIAARFNKLSPKKRSLDAVRHHFMLRRKNYAALVWHNMRCNKGAKECTKCLLLQRYRVENGYANCGVEGCKVCENRDLPDVNAPFDANELLQRIKKNDNNHQQLAKNKTRSPTASPTTTMAPPMMKMSTTSTTTTFDQNLFATPPPQQQPSNNPTTATNPVDLLNLATQPSLLLNGSNQRLLQTILLNQLLMNTLNSTSTPTPLTSPMSQFAANTTTSPLFPNIETPSMFSPTNANVEEQQRKRKLSEMFSRDNTTDANDVNNGDNKKRLNVSDLL